MRKKLAKLLMVTLICSALFGLTTAQAAESRTVRVGLLYGDNAVASTRLTNVNGTGHCFGYYNDALEFVSLGYTGESDINVLITHNLHLNSQGGYGYAGATANSRGAVGCYHLHLPWSYEDFTSAYDASQMVADGFVAWIDGTYYVRMGAYTSREDAEAALVELGMDGITVGETSAYSFNVVAAGTTRILFQFDAKLEGEAGAFGVLPGLDGNAGAVTTLNDENKYRGGFRFERIGGGAATVVNVVDMEDYVKGIIPYEMSASWPLEALKAQSVCARTYSVYTMARSRHTANHFDLCTSTHCQVYRGIGSANANSDQAVEETAGQLAYYNGKIIDAVYYSSNGGASEDSKNVWGNAFGYLTGKLDPYEADIADKANNYKWSKTLTASELKSRLNNSGYVCTDIVSVTPKQSPVGNVIELKVIDTAGKSNTVIPADTIRTALGLNSIRFTMTTSGGVQRQPGYAVAGLKSNVSSLDGLYALSGDGKTAALPQQSYIITADGVKALEPQTETTSTPTSYTFTGTGWGHSVGMSQWGAYAMAKQGYTYQDILKFYYTGITVE